MGDVDVDVDDDVDVDVDVDIDIQLKLGNQKLLRICCTTFFFFSSFIFDTSTFQLLDKPWSQVSSLPPGSCLRLVSRIGFSNPTARRFFIECC